MKSEKKPMTPAKLRLLLICALVLLALLGSGLFIVSRDIIAKAADGTKAKAEEAQKSTQNLSSLMKMEVELKKYDNSIDRASLIVAESKSYKYQDEIIRDITTLAKNHKIDITGIAFTSTSAPSAAASAPATPAVSGAATPAGATASGGLKSVKANITLKNPIEYKDMLDFIYAIQQNLTKMKIKSVGLSKTSDKPSMVNSDALTIEVYIK